MGDRRNRAAIKPPQLIKNWEESAWLGMRPFEMKQRRQALFERWKAPPYCRPNAPP